MRAQGNRRLRLRGQRMMVLLGIVVVFVAAACHPAPFPEIVAETETYHAEGGHATLVYLSAPRHADSGSRGECAWEENVNGRSVNMFTATAGPPYYYGLALREYFVFVSPNLRDDGYLSNLAESDNVGARAHLVTHSNAATGGCGQPAQYLLVMSKSGSPGSAGLTNHLVSELDEIVPGSERTDSCDHLAECSARAPHTAYLELFFHTNREATEWFIGDHEFDCAAGCGWAASGQRVADAIDNHLGNPRMVSDPADFPLDDYPGFGRSTESLLRDQTIAYWEAYEREVQVAECMRTQGFDYRPAVAYPGDLLVRIADRLNLDVDNARNVPSASPREQNAALEARLSADERERFNQALYGESAADIAEVERTGRLPSGREADFATAGCVGEARSTLPGIWDIQRPLNEELHADIDSSEELDEARAQYRECASEVGGLRADQPSDVDRGTESGAAVLEECESTWAQGYDRAAVAVTERFIQANEDTLTAMRERYGDLIETIEQDEQFTRHLTAQAALVESR